MRIATDGGITVDLWIADPSGMQRGVTRRHKQYRFTAAGQVTGTELEVKRTDR